jgi:hypothetical protein
MEEEGQDTITWFASSKMAVVFAALGFVVAVGLGETWAFTNYTASSSQYQLLEILTNWFWPTSLMLAVGANSGWVMGQFKLMLSALVNAGLYLVVGSIISALFGKIKEAIFIKKQG